MSFFFFWDALYIAFWCVSEYTLSEYSVDYKHDIEANDYKKTVAHQSTKTVNLHFEKYKITSEKIA